MKQNLFPYDHENNYNEINENNISLWKANNLKI